MIKSWCTWLECLWRWGWCPGQSGGMQIRCWNADKSKDVEATRLFNCRNWWYKYSSFCPTYHWLPLILKMESHNKANDFDTWMTRTKWVQLSAKTSWCIWKEKGIVWGRVKIVDLVKTCSNQTWCNLGPEARALEAASRAQHSWKGRKHWLIKSK